MQSTEFGAEDWIERLARALRKLNAAQERKGSTLRTAWQFSRLNRCGSLWTRAWWKNSPQNRVSGYLGTDAASRERIKESVKEFYEARSKIVHSREVNVSPPGNRESFGRGLDSCLRALRKGDVLVVWKLDRLGRNLAHLVNTVQDLSARGVGLRVLAGQGAQVDTTTAAGRLVFGIFAALAEFERELIRERTLAGLKAARARGRKGGRKFALSKAQVRLAQAAMAHRDTSVSELCRQLGIRPVTLYRYVGPQGQLREQGQKVLAS